MNKSKDYGKRSTDGGEKRLVQTWQWVSGALLITVCTPSWVDARDCLICCSERRHTGETRKVIGFYCSPNSWQSRPNFVREIPNFWSCICHRSEAWKYTTTPLCGDVGFCPRDTAARQETVISFSFAGSQREFGGKRSRRTLAFKLESPQWSRKPYAGLFPGNQACEATGGHCVQQEINLGELCK